jgi:C2 domain
MHGRDLHDTDNLASMVRYLGLLVLGACVTHTGGPFDSPWSYTIESASIDTVQPNGATWDPDNSPPDPYVVVYINNVQLDRTPEDGDTYTPAWGYTTESQLMEPGDTIEFEVQDSDVLDNDIISRCAFTASADLEGPHRCSDPTATLDVSINF